MGSGSGAAVSVFPALQVGRPEWGPAETARCRTLGMRRRPREPEELRVGAVAARFFLEGIRHVQARLHLPAACPDAARGPIRENPRLRAPKMLQDPAGTPMLHPVPAHEDVTDPSNFCPSEDT